MTADTTNNQPDGSANALRVAVEGCGHGTLDAIYASVQKACATKGWDGVDLVIIGGDFQAVRDRYDLNVTAMPAKYRTMADFHQYYWGTKTAPFLTIFIGGNHEASNHLFELYYGGWVAPNIYYLGAANVIQVGPLKIAGMSGIWKGYDYRKPHYERLPYSQDDIYSIYHVRELDVRKLLSVRSQVDIGISHDWPKGIEWLGDHDQLFRHKPHLQQDAQSGKLGSTAAQKVMDRLRPPYWFSAHLHTKYTALKTYGPENGPRKEIENLATPGVSNCQINLPLHASPYQEQLSAWNTFGNRQRKEEAEETTKVLEEEKARREQAERTGIAITANYVLDETHKKVKLGNGLSRNITSVVHDEDETIEKHEQLRLIPQLDGTCASIPLKRRRDASSSPNASNHPSTRYAAIDNTQADGSLLSSLTNVNATNPDAIDIDMSDDETTPLTVEEVPDRGDNSSFNESSYDENSARVPEEQKSSAIQRGSSPTIAEGIVTQNLTSQRPHKLITITRDTPQPHAETLLAPSVIVNTVSAPEDGHTTGKEHHNKASNDQHHNTAAVNEVSEEMRMQLAALSSKFEEPVQVSPSLPQPATITNNTTRFLALSKCEDRQNFLQLLEITPFEPSAVPVDCPIRLRYVPEWLAILRVFAPELSLGGTPKDQIPQHRGDTYYRERILEEEKWVQQNVVEPGLLNVPEDFITATPVPDLTSTIDSRDMPREVTNPQTSTFCNLIGIDNAFDINEEERAARIVAGPAESTESGGRGRGHQASRGGRGGRGSSSRGGRGRGNRGWGSRGRGRG